MPESNSPAVRIDSLSAGYRSGLVLRDITATIPAARVTAVVGPNGSGKSTLLGVIAGVLAPRTGTIHRTGAHRPALVPQHSAIPATLPITVRDTVAMGRWAHRGLRRLDRADRETVRDCMSRLGILELAHRRLTDLSGGQRQRALLAQALAQQSDLLLLDEPTTGLDNEARQAISDIVRAQSAAGVTVVHVTHDRDTALHADHCLLLRDGRLIAQGEPQAVLRNRIPLGATG
ncbi:zinc ABC transporter ATP-binding protein AztA [Nocardia sp. CDC159]|uniref:Zinc ABC transporter ATP-binding protein AztA n=1 Tax=Nocardia pulmonis TaxID=2951408 RepID=A0A9X2IV42_9NOCA|nr:MULTISPECIES: zinc ABC transporter ATP-binding protein AztA [Nocardia]MCM6773497.1 zinc ABC transporter ATP-binding protein AztA [Nocardia pulmonis]MCM6786384.1 zinc ABC transporter ATP-binding protein AztA [Nocardia sp. CDC159]